MGNHLINGEFQSDKYPWCERGFVPLKVTDPMAQPMLQKYAEARRSVDLEFSDDLIEALEVAGYHHDRKEPHTNAAPTNDQNDPSIPN